MLWILLSVLGICLIYWLLLKPYRYWPDKGVAQKTPIPIFGHNIGTVFKKISFAEFVIYIYNMFPNHR